MAKIIFKGHYTRANTNSKKISNTVKYIATREDATKQVMTTQKVGIRLCQSLLQKCLKVLI